MKISDIVNVFDINYESAVVAPVIVVNPFKKHIKLLTWVVFVD